MYIRTCTHVGVLHIIVIINVYVPVYLTWCVGGIWVDQGKESRFIPTMQACFHQHCPGHDLYPHAPINL